MKQQQAKLCSIVTLVALVLTMTLVACGAPVASPTSTPAAQATAPTFKPIWYAPAPHPYFEEVRKGIEAFEAETGIKVEKQIGPDWNQDSQNQRIEALAAQGYNAFSVYPADAVGANGLYEQLTSKGIRIINFGTSTAQPTTASFAVATDVKAAAMRATEELIKAMGGKGNIINVLEVLEDPNTALRKQGIEEVVAKYPDVKIIQEVAGMTSVETAVQKVGDALSANIDKVDGIIATGYTPSVAIAQVLSEYKSKGGERKIHAVGIDTDEIVVQAIKDGVMDGTIVQNPYGHGYLSMLLLQYLSEGYKPKANVYFVDAGFVFATKDNIETYTNDILAVTKQIKSELLVKYLEK
ncbi:sugar ABC transporter substrate-binding protein [Roseiflexus sp.]|uniref:sugar ABC transporter substrate-binding protein n=1 Tax=Roseiflexus sp. TaxID=2562120 RepID=UPI00398AD51B